MLVCTNFDVMLEAKVRPQKTMKSILTLLSAAAYLIGTTFTARAEIVGKAVEYKSGETVCEGWHTYDDSVEGKRPTVVIVHQWTGLTDYEKMRAEMLAKLGYNVFAVDIYGKGIRPLPPESGKMAGKFKGDRELYRKRLNDGLAVAKGLAQTDEADIAAIGYCFGGTGVLELARSGADIDGVVSFHGGLGTPTPEDAKDIEAKVLVLHGAEDPFVPADEVAAFRKEMEEGEVSYELVEYPGAVHAFTQKFAGDDPSKGAAYNAEADEKSWVAMREFFTEIFEN